MTHAQVIDPQACVADGVEDLAQVFECVWFDHGERAAGHRVGWRAKPWRHGSCMRHNKPAKAYQETSRDQVAGLDVASTIRAA
eukprot:365122-Chlamydomonas_euryale.AAC.11